jgi:two-component system nitrate/nitrite response regulator NarL
MTATKILLVDPNQLFREGIKRLLDTEAYEIVGETKTLDEACALTRDGLRPDLFVVDIGEGFGADTANPLLSVREVASPAKLVILTDTVSRSALAKALNSGIDAYLLKDMSAEALTRSLQLVMLGQQVFPTHLAMMLLGAPREETVQAEKASQFRGLSGREVQILRLLLNGASNKAIARELKISEATVKVHLKAVLRKVRASNRTQAAVWALNHGLSDEANVEAVGLQAC